MEIIQFDIDSNLYTVKILDDPECFWNDDEYNISIKDKLMTNSLDELAFDECTPVPGYGTPLYKALHGETL